MRIAILGATGHLSKCVFWSFFQDSEVEFFLFSRSKIRAEIFYGQFVNAKIKYFDDYQMFHAFDYDLIFNGIGSWDSKDQPSNSIFSITEYYDNLIMTYQKAHPQSMSIHVSSGAAYANPFSTPANENTQTEIMINQIVEKDFYSIAKINSEAKHRAFPELNIVDIRLFGFFSRYMSLEYTYLLSSLIRSVKNHQTFKMIKDDFWRDYIHMDDFSLLLHEIIKTKKLNIAIDVRSKLPISKNELVHFFIEKYGLKVEENIATKISKTGIKPFYYSEQKNDFYIPRYTSLEAVESELIFFMEETL